MGVDLRAGGRSTGTRMRNVSSSESSSSSGSRGFGRCVFIKAAPQRRLHYDARSLLSGAVHFWPAPGGRKRQSNLKVSVQGNPCVKGAPRVFPVSPAGGSGASPSGRPSKSNKTAPGLALGKPFELVQQKDESMGTAFFHTTSNLLTLLSLSPPFDKEGGEMVGIRRIFFFLDQTSR